MATKLTGKQKEAVFLLSIGTLLEYFDLMLYIHLSTILNDLFFPKTDPMITKILGATAFCMTFVLRPVGGYIIGRIGDTIGRKHTVLITTFLMAGSCLTMAMFPTYAEVGIWATIAILLCRMVQGFSSLGEAMGAGVYLAETLKSPYKYIANGLIDIQARMGGFLALGIASLVLNYNFSWRYAFFIGAGIAVIGLVARRRLRETPEFVSYQTRMKLQKQLDNIIDEKVEMRSCLAMALSIIVFPFGYYIAYMYLGDFMKDSLGMTAEQVINHNFKFSIIDISVLGFFVYLYRYIHPINIALLSSFILLFTLLLTPYCLEHIHALGGENVIFILQAGIEQIGTINLLMWMKHFPISKRFTAVAATFGISSAIGYAIVAYGLIPLTTWFGYYGIWVLFAPAIIGFIWALSYLMKLEKVSGAYDSYPDEPRINDTALEEGDFKYELDDEYEQFSSKCEYSIDLLNKLETLSKEQDVRLNIKVIEKAITFTKKWHSGQIRKTGEHPFYWHPLRVAEMVATYYCKTDVIVASLLHDTIEDSECTMEIIEKEFNQRIAEIVDRLTNNRFEDGVWIKLTLEQTLEKLNKLGDKEAMFIKLMDRQHNLETIKGLSPEKQKKMAQETNNHFIKWIAIIGDKLGVIEKMDLENKMYELDKKILKDNKEN
ncbi:MFS transporter [Candidatus Bandiella numerosa]|uniref:MFS transporter n=1 Tax=Candidatus Bandiella numerosa TaxID=2570586 RepID=UPI00249DFFEE|nr:MFS transporter [Candidatus Bandiella numerosa]WHA04970.1 MFS transporter [Candidatus Bandiella numerosa]